MSVDVSVLLPVRNPDPRLFAIAMKSTLRSRGVAFDVVVVDHGSDVPLTRAGPLADARVQLVRVERDVSFAGALEVGRAVVTAAGVGLVARMDGDDVMHPDRLREDVALLAAAPTLAAASSRVKILPNKQPLMRGYVSWQNAVLSASEHVKDAWVEQPICNPATTYRNSAIDAVGGWRARDWPEDYDLFLRFITHRLDVIKRPVFRHAWRQHFGQITRTVQATQTRDALAQCKAHHLVPFFGLKERRVVVVGSGREGRRMSRALAKEGVVVGAFLDRDPKKIGRLAHGCVVQDALGYAWQPGDFLLGCVGTSGARGAVRGYFDDKGVVDGKDGVVTA